MYGDALAQGLMDGLFQGAVQVGLPTEDEREAVQRMRGRGNGLYVAGLYVALRTTVVRCSPPGYEDYRVAAGTLALSLCILSALAACFYKAFRPVTVFLVVSFQALLDISRYAAVILLNAVDGWVPDIIILHNAEYCLM